MFALSDDNFLAIPTTYTWRTPQDLAASKPTPLGEIKIISAPNTAWALVGKDDASLMYRVLRIWQPMGGCNV